VTVQRFDESLQWPVCMRGPGVSRTNRASQDATSNRGPLGGRPVGLRPSGRETRRHGDEERNIGGFAASTNPYLRGSLFNVPQRSLFSLPSAPAPSPLPPPTKRAGRSPHRPERHATVLPEAGRARERTLHHGAGGTR